MKALKELYAYFIYFRRKLGAGIYLLMLFYFAGSYFNGFGISLLLPLLSVGSGGFQGEQFESLARFFAFIGAAPSFTNLLILFSVVFLAKGIFQFLQDWYRVSLATQFAANLQKNLAEDYSRLNFHYYSKTKSGFFTNIFTNEANNVVSGLYGYINAFGAGLNSVVLFAFALTINPYVTVAALVGGGVIFGLSTPLRDRLTQLSKGISQANGSLVHHFIQFIVGFKYLKSIEGYFRYVDRIENELQEARALQFRHALNKAFVNAVYEPATVIFLCAVIYLQVVKGGHTVTEIAVPLLLLNRFLTSFFAFQRYWHDFSGAIGSIHTLESAMESMAKNREHTNGRGVGELRRGIELKNLSFRYDDRQILNKINLFIPKNKCVAIVGESGAGKTTLLNVLSGLLPAHEAGSVLYDDLPYSELDKLELRAKFGYITQEAVLFDTTVGNNISLWKESSPRPSARLTEAARMAHCLEFVSNFPEGFDRVVGDRGTALSGGQRQRLMIAREIYRNPEILIFDEATSSLDSESEEFIQQTTRSFLGNKTMVIVAHRVSSLRFCDYIYVLKDGAVAEQGTWAELLEDGKDTYFAKIHRAQQVK